MYAPKVQPSSCLSGDTGTQSWDAENRLVQVKKGGTVQATFLYDGDGARVKATMAGGTMAYLGSHI
jgi:YD repeat-containing protein